MGWWFYLSLIALIFWSGSDLFSKMGSPSNDKYSHWKIVMCVGTIMGLHATITLLLGAKFRLIDMVYYLPASILYISSMILGYIGLRYLVLSLSTPVCNSSGAVTAILCFVVLGERPEGLSLVGVLCICTGIIAVSILEKKYELRERQESGIVPDKKYTHSAKALLIPVVYCLLDALGTFVDGLLLIDTEGGGTEKVRGLLTEESANIAYEFTFLFVAVLAFIFVYVIRKQKFSFKASKPRIAAGVCETCGQLAYVYAISANITVAAPMISAYCLLSMVWARLILHEKLTVAQYIFIGIAGIGIIILGME